MGSRRIKTLVVTTAVVLGGSFAGMGGGLPARAAVPPAVPLSVGTATVANADSTTTYTLTGSIAVGDGVFSGTASGAVPDPFDHPSSSNLVPAFTLSGPGLTGTCSGQWLLNPISFGDPYGITAYGVPSGPVNVVSLACEMQLGTDPPADTSLTLALVKDGALTESHYTGVYGPGVSSLHLLVPPSKGVVDRTFLIGGTPRFEHHLLGDIALGGQVFHGDASGGYDPSIGGPPYSFPLTGTSVAGSLNATCTENEPPMPIGTGIAAPITLLSCTGQVGAGPTGTTSLVLLLPFQSYRPGDGCGHCSSTDSTGVFVGN
jgi:hypothetical protein